ncbi:MAG: tryptophan 7-halogenase [Verrucomicrobiales bacterium]
MDSEDRDYDVIVVGAGPAGCTAAALLAEKSHTVLLLDKAHFPRYHIGESLMPYCWFTLDRLGLLPEMERLAFTRKLSVQFVTQDGQQSRPFYFFQHYDHPSSTTWQVLREEFDSLLLHNAAKKGALIRQGVKATGFARDPVSDAVCGVTAENEAGEITTVSSRMVIDATGRDALAMSKEGWRRRDPQLNKVAIWTYWRDAKHDCGLDAGSTTVAYLPGKGWFWFIPLRGGVTSVGIVAERAYLYRDGLRNLEAIFRREIGNNEWIRDHLGQGAQFGPFWVTGEYSYRSEFCAADGLVLVGDAFAFLDPVFSSGVFLALKSGEMAADAVADALDAGDVSSTRFVAYGAKLCGHIEKMRKLVYAFYDTNFSFGELIRRHPGVRGDLTDCLIGNLDRDFTDLQRAIGEIASVPADLTYGHQGVPAGLPV